MPQPSFSERYQYQALPAPMELEELSPDLRRDLWNAFRRFLLPHASRSQFGGYFAGAAARLLEHALGRLNRVPEDEVSTGFNQVMNGCKTTLLEDRFDRVLDLIEFLTNGAPEGSLVKERRVLAHNIARLFDEHAAPYSLDVSGSQFEFSPHASIEQRDAIRGAVAELRESGMEGAETHLSNARESLNHQDYAGAIRESVHAVESVARGIDPNANESLGRALDSLERDGLLSHRALRKAFATLYGYASDEEGIRHALVFKRESDVGLDEAIFMYGACASFVAFLIAKHRRSQHE